MRNRQSLHVLLIALLVFDHTRAFYDSQGRWVANELTLRKAFIEREDYLIANDIEINGILPESFPGVTCDGHEVYGGYHSGNNDYIDIKIKGTGNLWCFKIDMIIWHLDTWNNEYSYVSYHNGSVWMKIHEWKTEVNTGHVANICGGKWKDISTEFRSNLLPPNAGTFFARMNGNLNETERAESFGWSDINLYEGSCYLGCDSAGCSGPSIRDCTTKDKCAQGYTLIEDLCLPDHLSLAASFNQAEHFLQGNWSIGTRNFTPQDTFLGGSCQGTTFGLGDSSGPAAHMILQLPLADVHGQVMIQLTLVMIDWQQYEAIEFVIDGEVVATLEGSPKEETQLTNACGGSSVEKFNFVQLGPLDHKSDTLTLTIKSSQQIGVKDVDVYTAKCHETCASCSGNRESLCQTCAAGYLPHFVEDEEEIECKSVDNHSDDGCSPGYYWVVDVCQPCHSDCLTCDSSEETHCSSCYQDHLLHVGVLDGSIGSCYAESDSNNGCQPDFSFKEDECLPDCVPDDPVLRHNTLTWLNEKGETPLGASGEMIEGKLEVSLTLPVPTRCIQRILDVKTLTKQSKGALVRTSDVTEGIDWKIKTSLTTGQIEDEDVCRKQFANTTVEYDCTLLFSAFVEGDPTEAYTWEIPVIIQLQNQVILFFSVETFVNTLDPITVPVTLEASLVDENGNKKDVTDFFLNDTVYLKLKLPDEFEGSFTPSIIEILQEDREEGSLTFGRKLNVKEVSEIGDMEEREVVVSFPLMIASENLEVTIFLRWDEDEETGSRRMIAVHLDADDLSQSAARRDLETEGGDASYSVSMVVRMEDSTGEVDEEEDGLITTELILFSVIALLVVVILSLMARMALKKKKPSQEEKPQDSENTTQRGSSSKTEEQTSMKEDTRV